MSVVHDPIHRMHRLVAKRHGNPSYDFEQDAHDHVVTALKAVRRRRTDDLAIQLKILHVIASIDDHRTIDPNYGALLESLRGYAMARKYRFGMALLHYGRAEGRWTELSRSNVPVNRVWRLRNRGWYVTALAGQRIKRVVLSILPLTVEAMVTKMVGP